MEDIKPRRKDVTSHEQTTKRGMTVKRSILSAVLIGLMSLLITSCADSFLAQENIAGATAALYNTADGFEKGVNRAYAGARDFWGRRNAAFLTVTGTDIWTNGQGGPRYFSTYDPGLNAEVGRIHTVWRNLYENINTVNTVLAHAPEVEGMDPALKEMRVAELKFLRALYYFLLVRMWGPVPLHLEPVTGVDTEETRAPLPEVYGAIIKDLNEAVAVLPEEQTDWGRATKGAAQHLLALVYLTRGYEMDKPSDFNKAADLAKTVINSGNYELLDDYAAWFDIDNQINEEVIWSVQYDENTRANGRGNHSHLLFNSAYDDLPGMKMTLENGRAWNRFRPTKFFIEDFEVDYDSRYDKSFQTVWYTNDPGTYTIDGQEVTLAAGDTAIWMPRPEVDPSRYQNAPYTVLPLRTYRTNYAAFLKNFPNLNKHNAPRMPRVQWTASFRDFIVYRLAETYLIAAEALYQIGKPAGAAQYLNVVRMRAAWPGQEEEMRITPAQVTLDFILDEWARETAGEYQRWFTLTRTGTLVERVRKYNPFAAPNIQPYHALRPIPQAQIDAVTGEFKQNPGY